ncbi:hypothetical protein SRABI13_03706 [Erwinia aphidicola]|nr:hypothetical protein SRABI13_03706 [Erwinia aphidicola]
MGRGDEMLFGADGGIYHLNKEGEMFKENY